MGVRSLLWGLAVVLTLGLGTGLAWAEDTPSARFSANMGGLKTSLKAFSQTVDEYNRSIKAVTDFDVEAAKVKVAEIREQIKVLLDQLGDGSPLVKSQTELSRWIERNRRLVRTDTLLSSERKALLEKAWAERADEIERDGKEIVAVRKDLVEQLTRVVGDETYLTQLLFLEKAADAASLIRQFLSDIKAFSESLRRRMEALPARGPDS